MYLLVSWKEDDTYIPHSGEEVSRITRRRRSGSQ